MIYLDYAATSPLENFATIQQKLNLTFGNPGSNHKAGFEAVEVINKSKQSILKKLSDTEDDVKNYNIVLTSGSTESINTVFHAFQNKKCLVITTDIEHKAVLKSAETYCYSVLKLPAPSVYKSLCNIDFETIATMITDQIKETEPETILLSFTTVNNETGDIFDPTLFRDIRDYVKSICKNVYTHLDHTQGLNKIYYSELTSADFISFSGHKIGTFKGIGGLMFKNSVTTILQSHPLIVGGNQQNGIRSGTENALFWLYLDTCIINQITIKECSNVYAFKTYDMILQNLKQLAKNCNVEFKLNQTDQFSPYIINCSFIGVEGEALLTAVGLLDGCISTTSACNSNTLEPSYVLTNLGYDKSRINCAVRISWAPSIHITPILNFLDNEFTKAVEHLSKIKVNNIK